MREELLRLFAQEREKTVTLCGHAVRMKLLTAYEMLLLHLEEQKKADAAEAALWGNAALLCACLQGEEGRLFQSAEEVLHTLSLEEINHLVEAYRAWSGEVDPSVCAAEETVETLKKD